ncbi:MAG: hypothetical protein WC955_08725 [Elusimicrobiota bacterium]
MKMFDNKFVFVTLLAVFMVVSSQVCASGIGPSSMEVKNMFISGSADISVLAIDNETDFSGTYSDGTNDDYEDDTKSRVLLTYGFDVGDDIIVRLVLNKNNDYWDSLQGMEKLDNLTADIRVYNAYFQYRYGIPGIFGTKFTVGRQFFGNPGDLALYFGPVDDFNLSVNSLDMLRFEAERLFGFLGIDMFVSKLNEAATFSTTLRKRNWDTDLVGTKVKAEGLLPGTTLAVYYYGYYDQAPDEKSVDALTLVGLQLGGILLVENVKYGLEFCQDFGAKKETSNSIGSKIRPSYNGNGLLANLCLKSNPINLVFVDNIVSFTAAYALGSGDSAVTEDKDEGFWSLNPDLHYGDIWWRTVTGLGPEKTGSTGLQNKQVVDLVLTNEFVVPNSEKRVTVSLKYMKVQNVVVSTGDAVATLNLDESKHDVGNEIGLIIEEEFSKALSVGISFSQFNPGNRYTYRDSVVKTGVFIRLKFDHIFGEKKSGVLWPVPDNLASIK